MTSLVDIRTATDWLVLCDFDETFFAHDPAVRSRRDLADLAALVNSLSASRGLRFGFITGSAPSTVIAYSAIWPRRYSRRSSVATWGRTYWRQMPPAHSFPIYSGMRDSRRPRSFRPG